MARGRHGDSSRRLDSHDSPRGTGNLPHAPCTDTRTTPRPDVTSWLHPKLTRRAAWADCAELPIPHGTVIRLDVTRLPSGATAKPVWLWWSSGGPGHDPDPATVDLLWQAFLR